MHQRKLLIASCLVWSAACGPGIIKGDTDSNESDSHEPPGTSAEAPEPTTGAPEPTTGAPEPTTGAPEGCFPGQAPWTALTGGAFELGAGVNVPLEHDVMAPMVGGGVALAARSGFGDAMRPVLLRLSSAGELLGVTELELGGGTPVRLVQSGEGELVMMLHRSGEEPPLVPTLARFAADGSLLGEVALELPLRGGDVEVVGEAALVAGTDAASQTERLAMFTLATGAAQWEVELGPADPLIPERIALTPEGDVLLAARDGEDNGLGTQVRLWRFAGGGGLMWERGFGVASFGRITALELTPSGQAVAVRNTDAEVELLAFDPADGATLWKRSLAGEADPVQARALHVDADALTLPLYRRGPEGGELRLLGVEVARLSFAGEEAARVSLAEVPPSPGWAAFTVRGDCGELAVLTGVASSMWLGTFAP